MFPQPVMIIASYDEHGKANAMNAAWGGIVGMDQIIISLGDHQTTDYYGVRSPLNTEK